jgi:hypothetical protein
MQHRKLPHLQRRLSEITSYRYLGLFMRHSASRSDIIRSQCSLTIHGVSSSMSSIIVPVLIVLLHLHLSRLRPGWKPPAMLGLPGREQIDEE